MSRADDARKGSLALVGRIEVDELAVRLIEAMGQVRRPPGKTVAQVLASSPGDVAEGARRQAHAAIQFFIETLNDAQAPQ